MIVTGHDTISWGNFSLSVVAPEMSYSTSYLFENLPRMSNSTIESVSFHQILVILPGLGMPSLFSYLVTKYSRVLGSVLVFICFQFQSRKCNVRVSVTMLTRETGAVPTITVCDCLPSHCGVFSPYFGLKVHQGSTKLKKGRRSYKKS